MAFFSRVMNYVFNELLVDALANSKTFQRFAVRTDKALREAQTSGKISKLADAPTEASPSGSAPATYCVVVIPYQYLSADKRLYNSSTLRSMRPSCDIETARHNVPMSREVSMPRQPLQATYHIHHADAQPQDANVGDAGQ